MSKDIFVFIEQRDGEIQKVGVELLGKGRKLADDLGEDLVAIVLGDKIRNKANLLIGHGADKVIVVEDEILKEYVTEPYTKALYYLVKKYDPEILIYGASSIGRDLAPRMASRLHTGLTADCTSLDIEDDTKNLRMTRPAFGGNLMAEIICEDFRPQMATVRPGVMQALDFDASRKGEIIDEKIDFNPTDMNVKILEVKKKESKKRDITEAKVLVSGGLGVGGKDGFALLEDLKNQLDAEISSSRANVDLGIIEKDRQVGQTGKTVRPDLYLALGISGAIQHLAGMEESKLIIAVNKNKQAPIFDVADLGIVGDLKEIVPKLTELIKKEKEEKARI